MHGICVLSTKFLVYSVKELRVLAGVSRGKWIDVNLLTLVFPIWGEFSFAVRCRSASREGDCQLGRSHQWLCMLLDMNDYHEWEVRVTH